MCVIVPLQRLSIDSHTASVTASKTKLKPQPQTNNASKKASDSHAVRLLRSHKCEVNTIQSSNYVAH